MSSIDDLTITKHCAKRINCSCYQCKYVNECKNRPWRKDKLVASIYNGAFVYVIDFEKLYNHLSALGWVDISAETLKKLFYRKYNVDMLKQFGMITIYGIDKNNEPIKFTYIANHEFVKER